MADGDTSSLGEQEAAAVRFAEAVDRNAVGEEQWGSAKRWYSDVELLDLALLAGFYGLASRMTNALGVEVDEGLRGLTEYRRASASNPRA